MEDHTDWISLAGMDPIPVQARFKDCASLTVSIGSNPFGTPAYERVKLYCIIKQTVRAETYFLHVMQLKIRICMFPH